MGEMPPRRPEIREIAAELGVRYVLEGRERRFKRGSKRLGEDGVGYPGWSRTVMDGVVVGPVGEDCPSTAPLDFFDLI